MTLENPFLKRAAEHATEVTEFVDIFALKCLDKLDEYRDLLLKLHVILEATPGGGKTTLLKLITPEPLRQLGQEPAESSRYLLRQKLQALGFIKQDGSPAVLGIYQSLITGYETIAFNAVSVEGFLRLLDLRLLIKAIRAALFSCGGNFPRDLSKLEICITDNGQQVDTSLRSLFSGNCRQVFQMLSAEEQHFAQALSLHKNDQLEGHKELYSLDILKNTVWKFEGLEHNFKHILLLDDVHGLHKEYWESLRNLIPSRKLSVPIWYGVRSQVFALDELFDGETWSGTIPERDCIRIKLDSSRRRSRDTDAFLREVAEKRIRRAPTEVLSKGTSLDKFLGNRFKKSYDYKVIVNQLITEIYSLIDNNDRFVNITQHLPDLTSPTHETAINLIKLIIWMERERNRPQLTLFDTPEEKNLEDFFQKSEIRGVAELFLRNQNQVPYYYSDDVIIDIASGNVQQYLNVAGKLFNRVLTNVRVKRAHCLPPEDQDEILRLAAREFWNDIPRYAPQGESVQRFLRVVGTYCRHQTYRRTASYAPGITGIGISVTDYQSILKEKKQNHPAFGKLSEVMRICIAYNLFESGKDCIVRCKGRDWLVLYLNRLLCVYFDLPLCYGGFREQQRKVLCDWLEGDTSNFMPQEGLF